MLDFVFEWLPVVGLVLAGLLFLVCMLSAMADRRAAFIALFGVLASWFLVVGVYGFFDTLGSDDSSEAADQ